MTETIASILKKKGSRIYSVAPDATVHDALALMAENGIAAVLVLAEGRLEGILSAKDFGTRVFLRGRSASDTRVDEVMTRRVITVTREAKILECLAIMTRNHVRHLPVFDKGRLVGVVSIGDLASAVIADQAFQIDQLMTYMGHQ